MGGLHARSTSTCTPDVTLLRPRTPNNDTLALSRDFDAKWRMPEPENLHTIEPLIWQVPATTDWHLEEPLLEIKDHLVVPARKRKDTLVLAALWVVSMFLASAVTYWTTRHSQAQESSLGSLETGYVTDLDDARSAIRVKRQQFTGSLDFANRHGFIPADSPSQAFVGSGPEIDAAWDALTHDRYFLLSDDEARAAYGDEPERYWNVHHGGYVAGLDVLHTLHCLNHIRMALYPSVYPQDPQHGKTHQAHCLDHLRQLAMCHADLTPVPTQWFDGLQRNYINSSREHTCRDFSLVRDWATERFNGKSAVKPRNRDGSPRDEVLMPWTP